TTKGDSVSPLRWIVVALIALASASAVAFAVDVLLRAGGVSGLRDALATAPLPAAGALAVPFIAVWLAALVARAPRAAAPRRRASAADSTGATVAAAHGDARPPAPAGAAALQLLAVLQQEGRFVDFVEED